MFPILLMAIGLGDIWQAGDIGVRADIMHAVLSKKSPRLSILFAHRTLRYLFY